MRPVVRYLSILQLLVFACIFVPPGLLHDHFAQHTDTVCETAHYGEVTVESAHVHCSVFNAHSLLYHPPVLHGCVLPCEQPADEYLIAGTGDLFISSIPALPPRAPPFA